MIGQSVIQHGVGDSGTKATMETGVVAPERGMRVDGENSGEKLSEKKEENGEVERGSLEVKTFLKNPLGDGKGANETGE